MDDLEQSFAKSLVVSGEDAIKDCLELGIDKFITDGVLKEIPIVSCLVSGLKIAKNIYDRNLLRKTLVFINELNNGTISEEKLIAYRATVENNQEKCDEELGKVLIYLNSFVDKEKSVMLSKAFKSYINRDINWKEFSEYAEIISRIFVQDVNLLFDIYQDKIKEFDDVTEQYRLDRIASLGLIRLFTKSDFSFGTIILDNFTINKTKLGEKFIRIIK